MKAKFSFKMILCVFMSVLLVMSVIVSSVSVYAMEGVMLNYKFNGNDSETAGYAEGIVSLTSDETAEYYLYWADDEKALEGYYEIAKFDVKADETAEFVFDYHTAIPANATRIIATTDPTKVNVTDAVAQYEIPISKRLLTKSGELRYTFNSYSDVHIDTDGFYKNYEEKWAQALKFAVNKKSDFIVSSGDMVNNGTEIEWDIYQRILADSDFVKPVYESDGNHDIRRDVNSGLKNFVRATGTDNTIENYDANKPYYYVKEKNTGDIFIFMALEGDYKTHTVESFSDEQLNWLTNLLETNYGTGVNIYIIEHAPINGFGAGDRMDNPLYKSHLGQEFWSTVKFKALLEKYPELIWMSGHTHLDFSAGYNYSNENGKACNMIHNSAVIGSTMPDATDTALDYKDGNGFNSQGYFVEVYDNSIVYYGANLTDEKIYPAYCYIMEGSANSSETETNATEIITTATTTQAVPVVKLPGSFNDWATVEMDISGEIATMTIKLDADTYEFKIMEDDTWFGNSGTIDDATVTGWEMSESQQSNCKLKASGGTYIFNYNYSTNMLTVIHLPDCGFETTEPSPLSEPQESSEDSAVPMSLRASSVKSIPEYAVGDVNRDKTLDIKDVTCIQQYLADLISFDEEQISLAEINGDGQVNIRDATKIQRILANLDSETMFISAEKLLDEAYSFASYNQYQELKEIVYYHKNSLSEKNLSVTELNEKINALKQLVDHIGYSKVHKVQDTYYFVNTLGWSEVYGYAWTTDSNAAWPGLRLEKVGTHEGYDVYGIKFRSAGEYMNIIFTNGAGNQTVDIELSKYENNCFIIGSGSMTEGKYIPDNFRYDNADKEPTVPTEPAGTSNYLLRYYNGSAHGWDNKDTYFVKQADGTYVLNFITQNADSISCNVYNSDTGQYNCIASSTGVSYVQGEKYTFSLVASASRGKSITLNGLSAGVDITFIYNPTENTLNINF